MFQSQTRSRSTCDVSVGLMVDGSDACFNLRREAAPHATYVANEAGVSKSAFQSQTRSRSTCDNAMNVASHFFMMVSISDEKPLHMRQHTMQTHQVFFAGFQSQTRSRSTCDNRWSQLCNHKSRVSISDEKPLHMRHIVAKGLNFPRLSFNLRREAAPHATLLLVLLEVGRSKFQSQTRSRSTCDVSDFPAATPKTMFQSQTRSRSTCDFMEIPHKLALPTCFNLRREAAPHATWLVMPEKLQSFLVSISDEKPLHMRLHLNLVIPTTTSSFNLRREAAPHAT